jgi:hypothetical protein
VTDHQHGGNSAPTGGVELVKVPFGMSAPGQPPKGYPTGPGIDMYGDPVEVAHEDPDQRTGEVNEIPPPDPA